MLGDIDHHWHTFGYRAGMMNEFYEMKPGETAENVRRYNGESVLLTDLGTERCFGAGAVGHGTFAVTVNALVGVNTAADGLVGYGNLTAELEYINLGYLHCIIIPLSNIFRIH